jgi:Na+-transporting NADH:ubiquinone oxidoreductase subunit C
MKQTNGYVVGFAAAICLVCSLSLSLVSGGLKERQEQNRILDRQKNILMAVGYQKDELGAKSAPEVEKLYADTFEEMVVDTQGERIDVNMV